MLSIALGMQDGAVRHNTMTSHLATAGNHSPIRRSDTDQGTSVKSQQNDRIGSIWQFSINPARNNHFCMS